MLNRMKPRLKRLGITIVMLMGLAVIILSFVQIWVLSTTENVDAYGVVAADERGWPEPDKRGAYVMLNQQHDPQYPGNLVALLATTEPGVVDEAAGPHFVPADINAILIQSAALSEVAQYRVTRIGVPEQEEVSASRQAGGKVLLITAKDGAWDPGAYIIDIPAEGMFGGRTYFQFYVDPPK